MTADPGEGSVNPLDAILGHWARDDGDARVRIDKSKGGVCAVNTWIGNPSSGEKVGDRLIMSVKPKGRSVLAGTAFDPQRKLTYALEIRIAADRMRTKGSIFAGLISRTVSWTRIR